ncbi:MAG: beta-lactamase family protein [Flavobacteriia bacterium]|nr:beta-lactamase family protein [Flavobacteriia bacterium]
MRTNNFIISILSLLILVSCDSSAKKNTIGELISPTNYLPEFNEPSQSFINEKKKKCNDFYYEFMNPDRFSGMFLVAKNGKIVLEKYSGCSNYISKEEITAETPIHVASVSKVATSLAVLRLIDHKELELNEDIRTYLPEFPYPGISVKMLLTHRSGIPYYGYFTFKVWHLGKELHNIDVLKLLAKYKFPLNFPPDSHFAYCNTNFALLALIVERVTGEKFPIAMKELIFDPLKMKNTFVLGYKQDKQKVSQSYNSRHVNQGFDYMDAVYGDKNLYSTVRDLLKMDMGTYSKNFLSDSMRKLMFKGYSYEHPGMSNYGFGIRMRELEGKKTYFFHTGWWHGNTSCYATLRADTVCIIALSNVYNRSVYQIKRLAPHFGDYPFEFKDEE